MPGPTVKPRGGGAKIRRSRNRDGRWRKKRSDAGGKHAAAEVARIAALLTELGRHRAQMAGCCWKCSRWLEDHPIGTEGTELTVELMRDAKERLEAEDV